MRDERGTFFSPHENFVSFRHSPLTAMPLDHWVGMLLVFLAAWVLINGLDDLIVDIGAVAAYIQQAYSGDPNIRIPTETELDAAAPRRMAVFVAVWKENRVIQKMLDNNVARVRYPCVEFFVGAYPNDPSTIAAIGEAARRYPNVHLSVCPHDGPTSKADCLNWIYQRMLLFEEQRNVRFEMVLTHDAEDLMDPDALRWVNYYAQWNDFVQIPVLALPTPMAQISHGVYCDEFAEFQFKDMVARQFMGGFIPSNGVGTGFSRRALEALAEKYSNRIFEPGCLTEDYENGFRVASLGMKQKFIPIHFRHGRAIATREYFPQVFGKAVKQRSRWMIGLTLQTWEYHSFAETLRYLYWFWRDRKSLIGNLVTPLTNIVFLYGAGTWTYARSTHTAWRLGGETSSVESLCMAGLALQALHTGVRIVCCSRVYGARFACGVPVRVVAGNWINLFATTRAVWTYGNAKLRGQPLRWAKTEHAYPNAQALVSSRRLIGEILVGSQWISQTQLSAALASKPADRLLGEHLVRLGLIDENNLYAALSLQNNLPLGKPDKAAVSVPVTRALPRALARRWQLLPFRIAAGELYVAGAGLPCNAMQQEIRQFSSLDLRFHLITPTEFRDLARQYL